GNTGLVGGGIPDKSGQAFVLSLSRMNKVRSISKANRSMVVESGCILQELHKLAEEQDLYFPLNLAAKGSCTIGGNLATNAGGVNVVRYGNTRDLCLGIEVVLADGRVMDLLTPLRKDNTGYDLKHLFIGSEGTLGIITAASMKLFSLPKARATALAGIPDIATGVELLGKLQSASGEQVEAFEIMPKTLLDVIFKQFPEIPRPLNPIPDFMILMEIASSDEMDGREDEAGRVPIIDTLESFLADSYEAEMITDATLARNETQRQQLWDIREHAPESTKRESFPVNTDISVTRGDLQTFYDLAVAEVYKVCPVSRVCSYGHLGDGNLHFNVIEKEGGDPDWLAKKDPIKEAIYRALASVNGSISAEHGIGVMKFEQLKQVKDPVALSVMSNMKHMLDPKGILNPGKVID
ncbi:MAG: FAD-binding oxidoreductase, partial [Candidatus Puniceispirillaceae bacterium]